MPAPPSLYERAEGWHRHHMARCACHGTGGYPCRNCRREIGCLLDLLDKVASDAIQATMHATARFHFLRDGE